jgi:putative membrane protein
MWVLAAALSALFAGLTAVLAKAGIASTGSAVATALRTVVVAAGAWGMVALTGAASGVASIDGTSALFLVLSGLATGASWLAYYHALKDGPASVVVPIDKLSILVTVAVSAVAFHERFTPRYLLGLTLMCAGTAAMVVA